MAAAPGVAGPVNPHSVGSSRDPHGSWNPCVLQPATCNVQPICRAACSPRWRSLQPHALRAQASATAYSLSTPLSIAIDADDGRDYGYLTVQPSCSPGRSHIRLQPPHMRLQPLSHMDSLLTHGYSLSYIRLQPCSWPMGFASCW